MDIKTLNIDFKLDEAHNHKTYYYVLINNVLTNLELSSENQNHSFIDIIIPGLDEKKQSFLLEFNIKEQDFTKLKSFITLEFIKWSNKNG